MYTIPRIFQTAPTTQPLHIPDGYLSPLTALALWALALPFWYLASRRVSRALTTRLVPLIALMAAFTFVVMMFNVPLPGGTTGHAVGGTLAAIILGPWAAVIAVSMALAIQALFFGDGGLLAYGANAFNMAILLPFVGYALYRLLSGHSPATSTRRVLAAAVAGYAALNLAALAAAIEFGVQPYFFRAADGTPLYNPYALDVAIPAMMIPHLLVASVVEALVTGLVVAYLQRTNMALLELPSAPVTLNLRPLWIGLAILALLTPLGLLASGTAWGEWAAQELQQQLGFVPPGLAEWQGLWNAAPFPDYAVPGLHEGLGYILSAILGIAAVAAVVWGIGWVLTAPRPDRS